MDMRFGTWNVRSLNRSGSLKTVSGEFAKCKLDLVGVQEVRWDGRRVALNQQAIILSSMEMGMLIIT
jgi:exonuclease III